jgi:ribosome-binding protein aMBF1 (putative translation factor)
LLSTFVVQGHKVGIMGTPRRERDAKVVAEFGRRLRRLRLAEGWSQERMAQAAGVHRTYVGHIERGETSPTLYSIIRFADALDLEPGELVNGLVP